MQNLKRNFILIGLIVLFVLSLSILPAQAADNDILVYYTVNVIETDIFVTDLNNLGYNVTIIKRSVAGEIGLTPADPINLLDYGQVWIIDMHVGLLTGDAVSGEVKAILDYRNIHNRGLLLSVDDAPSPIANQIAREFNNNTDLFFGSQAGGGDLCYESVVLTVHPLYAGLNSLSSSNTDSELDIQNPAISITATHDITGDSYGAVLDDDGRGRIVFDTSFFRFVPHHFPDCTPFCCQSCPPADPNYNLDCSTTQESIYQQNIAKWLKSISGPTPPPTFFEGLVPCGRHYDNPDTDDVNESDECTVCHFFYLIKNLIDFVAGIAVVVAILFIAFGGVMYIGSTGNEAMLSKAKGIITYAIIGFILIFTAYIIIGLILSTFGYTNPLGGEWDVIC